MVVFYGGGSVVSYVRMSHCTANLNNIIHMNGFVLLSDHVWEVPLQCYEIKVATIRLCAQMQRLVRLL